MLGEAALKLAYVGTSGLVWTINVDSRLEPRTCSAHTVKEEKGGVLDDP